MKFTNTIRLAVAGLMLTACQSNSFKVTGSVSDGEEGDTLFLTTDIKQLTPIDTAIIKDGEFTFEGITDSTYLAMIYAASMPVMRAHLFIEPGNIDVIMHEQPGDYRVSGTKTNERWQQLNDSTEQIGLKINQIAMHLYNGRNYSYRQQQKLIHQIRLLEKKFKHQVRKAAIKNIDNEFGYFILTYYPKDVIDDNERMRLIKQMPENLRKRKGIKEIIATIQDTTQHND